MFWFENKVATRCENGYGLSVVPGLENSPAFKSPPASGSKPNEAAGSVLWQTP